MTTHRRPWLRIAVATAIGCLLAALAVPAALAGTLYTSTTQAAGPSGNNQFGNGEVFNVNLLDPPFSAGALSFAETNFDDGNANINAFALGQDGVSYLISTQGNETISGFDMRRNRVIAWNTSTNTPSLFLDGSLLPGGGTGNIDAIHELANGNVLFSSAGDRTLWGNGDVVEYNPSATNTIDGLAPLSTRIVFNETDFGANVNIDGISMNTGGNLLLSFAEGAVTLGANTFRDEDVFEVLGVGSYQMFFDGSARMADDGQDVNAFAYVPEPRSAMLMLIGLAGLARAGHPRE